MNATSPQADAVSDISKPRQSSVRGGGDINRAMPFSDDAEKGLLSCFFQDPIGLLTAARADIPSETFYHPANRLMYEAMLEIHHSGRPVEMVSLNQYLFDTGLMEKIGGLSVLAEVYSFIPTTAHYAYYRGILHDKYLLRRLISACTESIQEAHEYQPDVSALLDRVEQRVLKIRPDQHHDNHASSLLSVGMDATLTKIEDVITGKASSGYSTGFRWLDKQTSGLNPDAGMWFIGARPSVGKTSIILDMIRHNILEKGVRCGFFSMEMSSHLIYMRLLSRVADIPLNRLKDGSLNRGEQMRHLTTAAERLKKGAALFTEERPGLTLHEIAAVARRWVRNDGVQIIFGDFLQRMGVSNVKKNGSRAEEHSENSRGLANLQKELGVPIVFLAQLNRECEKRPDKRPCLSDFEGCGSIEQDADIALLLSRPKAQPSPLMMNTPISHVLFDIAKNRDGACEERLHIFDKPYASFRAFPVEE